MWIKSLFSVCFSFCLEQYIYILRALPPKSRNTYHFIYVMLLSPLRTEKESICLLLCQYSTNIGIDVLYKECMEMNTWISRY